MSLININICVTDIPREKIHTAKNGKQYLNITCTRMKEIDLYENTHTVYVAQTPEDRKNKTPRTYIGRGKEYVFESYPSAPGLEPPPSSDLPF